MPKKKKKDLFQQIIDKFLEKIEGLVDKTTIRDLIYLSVFISATYTAYWICQTGKAVAETISFKRWVELIQRGFYRKPDGTTMKLDQGCLAGAMVSAYIVLKLDIGDLTSALKSVSGIKVEG